VISPIDQRAAWLVQPAVVTEPWSGWVLADFSSSLDGRVPTDIVIADIDGNAQNDVVIATSDTGGISWFTPQSDNRLRWEESNIASLPDDTVALFDAGLVDDDTDIDVVAPIDTEPDLSDRVDFFQNPLFEAN